MESVKYTVAEEADEAVKIGNNNNGGKVVVASSGSGVAGDAASDNKTPDGAQGLLLGNDSSHNNNNYTNIKVVGDVAGDNKAPDNARALPSSHTSSHNNNNNVTSDKDSGEMPAAGGSGGEMAGNAASNNSLPDNTATVPAGAAALLDQDVVMREVGLALANSLARAIEDAPSDARAWTPIQFPDGVLGMVALHPDTTVGAINGRLANMFGPRCWFLGFQMVAGYTIAAPPRYTMRDLGELRTDLAIGSFMEDYYEE